MSKRKSYMYPAICLALLVSLTACGGQEQTPSAGDGTQSFPLNVSEPQASSLEDTGAEGTLTGSGVYQGQGDTTSIEITVDGKPQVFQLGEVPDSVLDGIETGDKVQFEYTEQNVDQDDTLKLYTLVKLEKAGSEPADGAADFADLPQEKDLSVTLEGNEEQRPAKLVQGNGYALYVPEGFSFDPKENKLSMDVDPHYFAAISKAPADSKLEYLKFEADQELSDVGRVKELTGDEIAQPMRDAQLFMLGDGSLKDKEYIVKTFGGQEYIFRLEIPVGEPSEGFSPLAYGALNSLVTLK